MTDWNKYRELFPHLKNQIYLNHAAISPMNSRAGSALAEFYDHRQTGNIEFFPEAMDRKKYFTEKIGELINAKADSIALAPNTSAGLNILALGLDWEKGDRILLNDFEFPSNVVPFMNLRRLGVEIDFVQHREGIIHAEDIESKIHPRTRLLSISFVEFLNGYRNDLYALAEICRKNNIIFSVDAIQGLGALQMDVQSMGIDFLATGGHKWLMWPAGLGFIYISPRIFDRIYPTQAGWLSVETPWDFFNYEQKFAEGGQRFEPGTMNTTGIIASTATLEMMLEIGTKKIENKILENTDYLIQQLLQKGYHLFTSTDSKNRSGIVSFFHERAEDLFNFLKTQSITVSLREGKIRISPHFYNNKQDLDKCLQLIFQFDK